jgi:hydroxyacylglutathione hydrolase
MEIHPFILGSFGVSAYVVHCGHEALVIDAPEGAEAIVAFCKDRGLQPRLLVNTHGHGDHIQSNAVLKAAWPDLQIAIGKGDEPMLASATANLSAVFGFDVTSPPANRLLVEGDRIDVGDAALEVLATPGHTPGGISLLARVGPDGRPAVFTGDALFAGSIGRTDFPGASHRQLVESIRRRLLTLPPETIVYPGHGPPTTIGEEVAGNPFLEA